MVNVALILGLALLIAPIPAPRGSLRRDFPVALGVPVVIGLLLVDGRIGRLEGILLLAMFTTWLVAIVREAISERSSAAEVLGETEPKRALLEGAAGLVLLIAAGKLIVYGAAGIAKSYGISDYVIGATIVALGTSVPELATAIVSRLRGHDEVGLGTILGSNIFNGLFIVGVAALLSPINVSLKAAAPALVLGALAVALTFPPRHGMIDRWRGGMLLALYAVYVVVAFQTPA